LQITAAARSKACAVFGLNPIRGTEVCMCIYSVCVVLWVDSNPAMSWSPSKESFRLYIGLRLKSGQGPLKGCTAIIITTISNRTQLLIQTLYKYQIYPVSGSRVSIGHRYIPHLLREG
jgi:hypothetical protein